MLFDIVQTRKLGLFSCTGLIVLSVPEASRSYVTVASNTAPQNGSTVLFIDLIYNTNYEAP